MMKVGVCGEHFDKMTDEESQANEKSSKVIESETKAEEMAVVEMEELQDMPILTPEIVQIDNKNGQNTEVAMDTDNCEQEPPLSTNCNEVPQIVSEGSNSSEAENSPNPAFNNIICKTPTSNGLPNGGTPLGTPSSGASNSKKRKRLTPEERIIRDQERQEKRRKLEEEKQRKEQEKLERIRAKEEEKRKREEEKRLKDDEKKQKEEERLKKIEEDKQKKEEERQKREEEKIKREEEKKKKEEERLQKEEVRRKREDEKKKIVLEKEREKQKEEEIKAKQAQKFTNFFKATPPANKSKNKSLNTSTSNNSVGGGSDDKENESSDAEIIEIDTTCASTPLPAKIVPRRRIQLTEKKLETRFNPMPFQLKTDMNVAPTLRRTPLSDQEKQSVDIIFATGSPKSHSEIHHESKESKDNGTAYIASLKLKGGRKCGRTDVKYDSDVQVIVGNLIDNPKEAGLIKWRMKLIQFSENRRPPFWGTCKRRPIHVKGRRPFAHEEELDYDFDSDDEWEDEPEDGEDLTNSDKEDEKEPDEPEGEPDDEEDEEGWMVPHGYLSDGEGGDHLDLETIKTKEQEFYKSLKQKTLMHLPIIETDDLREFSIIMFPHSSTKKIRRSRRTRKIPTSPLLDRRGGGILSLELPNSDDEDVSWSNETNSESDSDSASDSDVDSDILSEEEDLTGDENIINSESDDDSSFEEELPVKIKVNRGKGKTQTKTVKSAVQSSSNADNVPGE